LKKLSILLIVVIGFAFKISGVRSQVVIEDIFGRQVDQANIILVDWEGYLANPAIKLFIKPPDNAALPGTAIISSSEPRMYFDLPSTFGENGPSKSIGLSNSSSTEPFLLSIFPDRNTEDEDHILNVQFTDANNVQTSQSLNIHVIDQDIDRPLNFEVTVDFSQDQTGFFDDEKVRALAVQAANDWAYFVDDMNLDNVAAGEESSWIWNSDGFNSGYWTPNTSPYKGFLLYAFGIYHEDLRSGGAPTYGAFQTSNRVELPLRRSGHAAMEVRGNYNTLGWYLTSGDDDWWFTGNLGNEMNDFYSIMHHEIGHALFFNPGYPIFEGFKTQGFVEDSDVLEYHGSSPNINAGDHFNGEVDNASRRGVFGYEYFGAMPKRRWLITKLDLLIAQAIGYELRETSAFVPLLIPNQSLPEGTVGEAYTATLGANGGIPFYNWSIESGTLPDGLMLDSFTGTISGTPSNAGTFNFAMQLIDYAEDSVTLSASIKINSPPTSVKRLDDIIPSTYRLQQNYPNPFNPTTTIQYDLPEASNVVLKIYNLQGKEISTLVSDRFSAGKYKIQWDASGLTSGIYYYQLQANKFVETKTLILLK